MIGEVLNSDRELARLKNLRLIRDLFSGTRPANQQHRPQRRQNWKAHFHTPSIHVNDFVGSCPDLAVLNPRNQQTTVVTQDIAELAKAYYHESFNVTGPPPSNPSNPLAAQQAIQRNHAILKNAIRCSPPGHAAKSFSYQREYAYGANKMYFSKIDLFFNNRKQQMRIEVSMSKKMNWVN